MPEDTFNIIDENSSQRAVGVPPTIAILAGIGDVCLQWARLEMIALSLIGAFERQETEATWLRFGGLDLIPRLNLSLLLAQQKGIPAHLAKSIRHARGKVQGKRGLAARRNEVVHGAHKEMVGNRVTLTMTRYPEGNRDLTIDPLELHGLAREIHSLGDELWELWHRIWELNLRNVLKAKD